MDTGAYRLVQQRIAKLVTDANADSVIPSCPDWRVRDLVAHLAGLCEDWVAGRLDGYASEAWTASQVARFSDLPVQAVLGRWEEALEPFAALEDHPVMGPPARWAFGDAVIHEADLRGTLKADRVPADAVALALRGSIGRWRQVLGEASAPTLLLRAPELREWWLGVPDDPQATTVEAPAYEVFRALAGRRTEDQMRSWQWEGDPGPFLRAGLPYPFQWASAQLTD
ncbi:MAG TPA: maleylpyruvate isomerase N-terminal domain-containing protein [Acidimicrobiales bacterium]|nr:maleylpyruvate isomerase N-terminal domain-containing protein [Acidimicrobiales bacterium]